MQKESGGDLQAAVDLGYRLTLGRPPSPAEKDRALTYLENDPARLKGFAWLLFNLDEFIYVTVTTMDLKRIYPCGRLNRRGFLHQAGGGFFGVALGALWAEDGKIKDAICGPHFTPKAKSVIFLFMCGGVSHIDTFDPKDNKYAGKLIDAIGFGDNVAEMKRPVIPILRTFTRYGKSGIPVSDWFPNVGGVIDEIRRGALDVVQRGEPLPGRDRDHHRAPRPPVRSPDPGHLGLLRAGHRQQESADVRQHRPRRRRRCN